MGYYLDRLRVNRQRVQRVEIAESSGDLAFDQSVEQAVLAASPLPLPRDPTVFDRGLVFLFNLRG